MIFSAHNNDIAATSDFSISLAAFISCSSCGDDVLAIFCASSLAADLASSTIFFDFDSASVMIDEACVFA